MGHWLAWKTDESDRRCDNSILSTINKKINLTFLTSKYSAMFIIWKFLILTVKKIKILRLNEEAVFAGWPTIDQFKKSKNNEKNSRYIKYACSEHFEFKINVYFNWKYLGKSILEKWSSWSWISYLTSSWGVSLIYLKDEMPSRGAWTSTRTESMVIDEV